MFKSARKFFGKRRDGEAVPITQNILPPHFTHHQLTSYDHPLITTANGDQLRANRNLESLINLLLARLDRNNLISIGDSHSRIFSDLPRIKVCHIGPVTAYNLVKENSSTQGREKIHCLLDGFNPLDTALILSFGEIDIRVHVIKAAIKDCITINESSKRTANNYCSAITEIIERGYLVLIQGVHASSPQYDNYEFPAIGSVEDRNYAVKQFNSNLEEFCISCSIPYASLDDIVIDSNLKTRSEFVSDGCHLNFNPELQGILLSRFAHKIPAKSHYIDSISSRMIDISKDKPYVLTSSFDDRLYGFVSPGKPYFFHTDIGINQGLQIDLQAKFQLNSLSISNRFDGLYDRAHSLVVILYDMDKEILRINISDDSLFLAGRGPTELKFPSKILASKVAIISSAYTCLHFANVSVFALAPARSSEYL